MVVRCGVVRYGVVVMEVSWWASVLGGVVWCGVVWCCGDLLRCGVVCCGV